jgi:hypothetical protein
VEAGAEPQPGLALRRLAEGQARPTRSWPAGRPPRPQGSAFPPANTGAQGTVGPGRGGDDRLDVAAVASDAPAHAVAAMLR